MSAKIEAEVAKLKLNKHNKKCFTCAGGVSSYIATPYWVFVCDTCGGIMRDIGAKARGISMTSWTKEDVQCIKEGGNKAGKKQWLRGLDPEKRTIPNSRDKEDVRAFMKEIFIAKLYKKKSKKKNRDKSTASFPTTFDAPFDSKEEKVTSRGTFNTEESTHSQRPSQQKEDPPSSNGNANGINFLDLMDESAPPAPQPASKPAPKPAKLETKDNSVFAPADAVISPVSAAPKHDTPKASAPNPSPPKAMSTSLFDDLLGGGGAPAQPKGPATSGLVDMSAGGAGQGNINTMPPSNTVAAPSMGPTNGVGGGVGAGMAGPAVGGRMALASGRPDAVAAMAAWMRSVRDQFGLNNPQLTRVVDEALVKVLNGHERTPTSRSFTAIRTSAPLATMPTPGHVAPIMPANPFPPAAMAGAGAGAAPAPAQSGGVGMAGDDLKNPFADGNDDMYDEDFDPSMPNPFAVTSSAVSNSARPNKPNNAMATRQPQPTISHAVPAIAMSTPPQHPSASQDPPTVAREPTADLFAFADPFKSM